jgi:ferric-dicitrate binding protein FerR (iron transport regulator)
MEERIRYLINKYLEEELTEAESRELSQLAANNDEIFNELLRIQEEGVGPALRRRKEKAEARKMLEQVEERIREEQVRSIRAGMKKWLPRITVAAAFVLVISLVWLIIAGNKKDSAGAGTGADPAGLTTSSSDGPPIKALNTPRGAQSASMLPDGTRVWLNSLSSIRYALSPDDRTREVILTGEAYFEVSNDPNKPFLIKVEDKTIEVLGTSLDVKAYLPGKLTTTLTSGRVRVTAEGHEQVLNAHEQLTIQENTWTFSNIKKNPDFEEEALAWKSGRFYFLNRPLSEILSQLERWYDVDIDNRAHTDPVVYMQRPQTDSLSSIVRYLQQKTSFRFRIEGKKLLVTE